MVYTSCSFRIINYLLDQIILEVKRGKVDCIESTEIGRRLGNLEHGNDDCQTSVYRLHARIYACGYTDQGISAITEHSATRWMYQPLESNSLLWLFSLPFHRSQPLYLPLYFAHYAKICSTIHDTRLNPSPRVTGYQGSFRDDSLATVSFYLNDTHTHTHTPAYRLITRQSLAFRIFIIPRIFFMQKFIPFKFCFFKFEIRSLSFHNFQMLSRRDFKFSDFFASGLEFFFFFSKKLRFARFQNFQ